MEPQMHLEGDEIVEASLLRPMDNRLRSPQHWYKRLYSLEMNWSPRRLRRLLYFTVNTWRKLPNPKIQQAV